jgi:hypothetical protein
VSIAIAQPLAEGRLPVRVVRTGCDPTIPPPPDEALDELLRLELETVGFVVVETSLRAPFVADAHTAGWQLGFVPVCRGSDGVVEAWRVRVVAPRAETGIRVDVAGVSPDARRRLLAATAAEALRSLHLAPEDEGPSDLGADGPDGRAVGSEAADRAPSAAPAEEAAAGAASEPESGGKGGFEDDPTTGLAEEIAAAAAAAPESPWSVRLGLGGVLAIDTSGERPAVPGAAATGSFRIEGTFDPLVVGAELWPAVLAGGDRGFVGAWAATAYLGVWFGPTALGLGVGGTSTNEVAEAPVFWSDLTESSAVVLLDPWFRAENDEWLFEQHVLLAFAPGLVSIAGLRHELRFSVLDDLAVGLRGNPTLVGLSELSALVRVRVRGEGRRSGTVHVGATIGYAWITTIVRCEFDALGRCTDGNTDRFIHERIRYDGPTIGVELELRP